MIYGFQTQKIGKKSAKMKNAENRKQKQRKLRSLPQPTYSILYTITLTITEIQSASISSALVTLHMWGKQVQLQWPQGIQQLRETNSLPSKTVRCSGVLRYLRLCIVYRWCPGLCQVSSIWLDAIICRVVTPYIIYALVEFSGLEVQWRTGSLYILYWSFVSPK